MFRQQGDESIAITGRRSRYEKPVNVCENPRILSNLAVWIQNEKSRISMRHVDARFPSNRYSFLFYSLD